MAFFGMRFDFRNPSSAATTMTDRYRAGIDMAAWAERQGFIMMVLSEHHGSDDGYLPSALTMAAAMAARTTTIRISVSAIVAPLYDPVHLAEQAAVVDLISAGRLDLVLVNGYVDGEFDMFGVPMRERAGRVTRAVEVLRAARSGEPVDVPGGPVRITPQPESGGPKLSLGGSTPAAARRAARIADGFMPSMPDVWTPFREARIAAGNPDPGPYFGVSVGNFHLADDVERGWDEVGPYFLHETNAYGRWMADAGIDGMYHLADDVDDVRRQGMYRVLTPEMLIEEVRAAGPFAFVLFHPMLGGIPPASAWRSLHLFENDVMHYIDGSGG